MDDDKKLIFKVTCSEEPHNSISSASASGAWKYFVSRVYTLNGRKTKPRANGLKLFGLSS